MNKMYYVEHMGSKTTLEKNGWNWHTRDKQEADFIAWSKNMDLASGAYPSAYQVKEFSPTPYLDVPYKSQIGPDANARPGDCGPACIAMITPTQSSHNPSVNKAATACGQPTSGGGQYYTNHAQLRTGAKHYGWTLETRSKYRPPELTLELLEAQVDAGLPSIALIHYGVLRDKTNEYTSMPYPKNQDQKYDRGHWVVFIGYDARDVYIHDPYFFGTREQDGNARRVHKADFEAALEAVAPGCSVGFQGLVVQHG